MKLSVHSLHPVARLSDDERAKVGARLAGMSRDSALNRPAVKARSEVSAVPDTVSIPLSTVTQNGGFDAYLSVRFQGQPPDASTTLLVDSGNSTLIVPRWEDIEGLPGYTKLGEGKEPWGSPTKIVRGPIELSTSGGGTFTIPDCVFYACTDEPRTNNFGAGCIRPWSASPGNIPDGIGVTMQSPLSYNTRFPFAEFDYAPAETVMGLDQPENGAAGSWLVLYETQPAGYQMLNTIEGIEWMSVVPSALAIGGSATQWPRAVPSPIAMVDTGGGPVFLSDPLGSVYNSTWPPATQCPDWSTASDSCTCTSGDLTIALADPVNGTSYTYTIKRASLPPSVQGLTGVLCKVNQYMMGQQGMNIGGISALFNLILIDYSTGRVGFKPK